MDRRLVAVSTTVAFLILALVDSAVAGTSNKQITEKKRAVITRASKGTQSGSPGTPGVRTTQKCVPCAAELAGNTKNHSARKPARTSKSLPCHPKTYIDPKIAVNYSAAVRDMHRVGIKPQVTSAWRSSENQEQLYRCSMSTRCRRANPGLYRALPAGQSLHEAGFAVDMSGIAAGPRGRKRLTPQGRRIVGIMRKNGFNWRYGLADPAHFEADPRKHGYRNVQQAISKSRTTCHLKLGKTTAPKNSANRVGSNSVQAPANTRLRTDAVASKTRRHSGKIGP